MADIEKGLLSRIVLSGEIQPVLDRKIEAKMVADDDCREAFEFVLEFYHKYSKLPSVDLIEEHFPDLRLRYVKEPVGYYIDELLKLYVRTKSSSILMDNARLLVTDPMGGLDVLRSELVRLTIETSPTRDENLIKTVEERKKHYLKMKESGGVDGYPTPWEVLSTSTMGWHPGEFISVVSRPAVGKCVAWDSLIPLPDGRQVEMQDFVQNREPEVLSLDEQTGKIVPAKVKNWIKSGRKQVYRVRTRRGRTVRVTSCHPFLTPFGWKSMDEGLSVGDQIAVPTRYNVEGKTDWAIEEVEMVALMLAEGCTMNNQTKFSTGDEELVEMAKRVAEYYGTGVTKLKSGDYDYAFSDGKKTPVNPVRRRLVELGGVVKALSSQKRIPEEVFGLKPDLLKRFVEVMFDCDGSNCGHYFEFSSASESIVLGLRSILLRFGIVGQLRWKENNGQGAWVLSIRGKDAVEFDGMFELIDRKRGLSKNTGSQSGNYVNIKLPEKVRDEIRMKSKHRKKELTELLGREWRADDYRLISRGLSVAECKVLGDVLDIEALRGVLSEEVMYDEVVSIEDEGVTMTYDLEIEGTHNFVADDVVVHNTFMLVIFAEYAFKNDLNVLFVNNEMSGEQIGKRFDAVHFRLPYQEFRAGLLSDELEKRYFEGLKKLSEEERPLWVISDVHGVMSIASKIDQYKPDIVMIDGLYLLHDDHRGANRWERTSNISRDLKRLAQQKGVPVIATTQFNRAADETRMERVTLANIGFSDSLGQDCLRKCTLIWTNRGLVRLDELDEEKDRVWDGEQFRRFKVLKEKEKEIYEVRLKNDGQVFECSGDHGLLVMSKKLELEWKKAKDLSPGDYVVRAEHVLEAGVEHKISWKYSPVSSALKTVRIPDKVDEDVAELLGIMVAEGWYAAKKDNTMSIAFGRKEVETRQYYAGLIEKLFGYVPKHKQNPKKNVDSLLIHSTEIIRWLRSVGLEGKTAREKTVPWTILQGTPEIRKAFLRGLFTGDGTVEKSGIVSTVSGSKKLTQQVYQLLRSLGFTPTIREHVMKSNGHSYWRIKVRAADAWKFKEIGIRGDEKERRLDKRDDGVLIERQFGFDEVESIKATGVVESMYDLNVEESHRFVAEGLMVHNSDIVLGLFRDRDMEMNNEMLVRMLKCREGQEIDFTLLWDLHQMKFEVLETDDRRMFIEDEVNEMIDF